MQPRIYCCVIRGRDIWRLLLRKLYNNGNIANVMKSEFYRSFDIMRAISEIAIQNLYLKQIRMCCCIYKLGEKMWTVWSETKMICIPKKLFIKKLLYHWNICLQLLSFMTITIYWNVRSSKRSRAKHSVSYLKKNWCHRNSMIE